MSDTRSNPYQPLTSALPSADTRPTHEEDAELGAVQIHNGVIGAIARLASLKVEGVVDMAGNLVDGLAGMVGRKTGDRGVRVEVVDNTVVLDLHVILRYGCQIQKVCWQIQHDAREAVERMTGKAVRAVNVIVESVRLPDEKPPAPALEPGAGA